MKNTMLMMTMFCVLSLGSLSAQAYLPVVDLKKDCPQAHAASGAPETQDLVQLAGFVEDIFGPETPKKSKSTRSQREAASPKQSARGGRCLKQVGSASFYGNKFIGRRTASGQIFTAHGLTIAHMSLPMGTKVRLTNLQNHKTIVATVNDTGNFGKYGRIADMSPAVRNALGVTAAQGIARKVELTNCF